MRTLHAFWLSLFAVSWLGCSTVTKAPIQQAWEEAEVECYDPRKDQCVSLLCLGDACGFYPCGGLPGEIELARFPPARPPAAAAAPGMGPRRNWGGAQELPKGAVMVFPNWNGAPDRIIPPSHQLTPGRWEKHHIFPQTTPCQCRETNITVFTAAPMGCPEASGIKHGSNSRRRTHWLRPLRFSSTQGS
jgi:uncharacterized lipoprotein (TIGR02269 family)